MYFPLVRISSGRGPIVNLIKKDSAVNAVLVRFFLGQRKNVVRHQKRDSFNLDIGRDTGLNGFTGFGYSAFLIDQR